MTTFLLRRCRAVTVASQDRSCGRTDGANDGGAQMKWIKFAAAFVIVVARHQCRLDARPGTGRRSWILEAVRLEHALRSARPRRDLDAEWQRIRRRRTMSRLPRPRVQRRIPRIHACRSGGLRQEHSVVRAGQGQRGWRAPNVVLARGVLIGRRPSTRASRCGKTSGRQRPEAAAAGAVAGT